MHYEWEVMTRSTNSFFNAASQRIWTKRELANVLEHMWQEWNLGGLPSTKDFITFLLQNTRMEEVNLPYSNFTYHRYWWGEPNFYEVASALTPRAYLSHQSALHLNNLTDTEPACVYANAEQLSDGKSASILEQGRIDAVFKQAVRATQNIATHKSREIFLITGKNTRNLGVVETRSPKSTALVRVTNLDAL